ncbi:uroporphyrinogen-III synthase [Catenovulum sp. 2E275]|uniref:uroporphyrinogen-III synthase n=1 Tax=Catenovulum sp. 2E275 TaxID=2980497 RepID=UPI0021CEF5F5|nr:uroporphyrinogen-III synthase [Catenovulum sp. 2E275]MCU4675080.1 uroporphyrinogen-III synthase [Catenovulum sp. 2E275]
MATNKHYVFHTRQGERAEQLNLLLSQAGFISLNPELYKISQGIDLPLIQSNLSVTQSDCLIFTSQYAVQFLLANLTDQQLYALKQLACVAVGQATADYLTQHGFNQVAVPQQHTSEGILALAQIQACKRALLFKGEQGRDHILQSFKLANKDLKTYNVYKRDWQTLTNIELENITQADYFVFTSAEAGLTLIKQAPEKLLKKLKTAPCLVPSERVKNQVEQYGLTQVNNIHSANNQSILKALNIINGNQL